MTHDPKTALLMTASTLSSLGTTLKVMAGTLAEIAEVLPGPEPSPVPVPKEP